MQRGARCDCDGEFCFCKYHTFREMLEYLHQGWVETDLWISWHLAHSRAFTISWGMRLGMMTVYVSYLLSSCVVV